MEAPARREYTYCMYCQLADDIRYEVINGNLIHMEPSPDSNHQSISGAIFMQIGDYLTGKPCRVFSAPFDVVLHAKDEDALDSKNVVQPDLLVVCDTSKIQGVCIGAPDLIVEILSPSTVYRDLITKKNLYEKYGVPEY